jgi:hypothetical protein
MTQQKIRIQNRILNRFNSLELNLGGCSTSVASMHGPLIPVELHIRTVSFQVLFGKCGDDSLIMECEQRQGHKANVLLDAVPVVALQISSFIWP